MPTIPLSDMKIRSLEVPKKRITYFDSNLSGFGVRVAPSGLKTFTLLYGPTRKRITLGKVGVISLADARREAKRILAEHTLGKARPEAVTFKDALDEFLEESSRVNKEITTYGYKRHLNKYFKFGRTPLAEITKQDIKIKLNKLNHVPSEKRHAYVAIRRLMRWAIGNQYIAQNPVNGIRVENQRSREHVLTPDEAKRVLKESLMQKTPFHSIVALIVLTGQRRSEIASLQWDWIDGGVITLPETKGGRIHMFPIGALAQKVISNICRESRYLFPASVSHVRGNPTTTFNGWGKAKDAFDKKLKKVDPYTLHDLRRTFATNLAMLGTPIHVTERLLNHVSGTHSGVVGVYQRYSYMDEMREALGAYEGWLVSL